MSPPHMPRLLSGQGTLSSAQCLALGYTQGGCFSAQLVGTPHLLGSVGERGIWHVRIPIELGRT